MKNFLKIFIIIFFLYSIAEAKIRVKLKNIVNIDGLRKNQLIGYGLVTGLNGTGDSKRFKLTSKILTTVLENIGVEIDTEEVYSKNTALVLVTAFLPATAKKGETIDVEVSSVGDAKNISDGILLQTPLRAADGKIYAVAQGKLTVADTANKNLNFGIIPNGAIIETDLTSNFIKNNKIILNLETPDFGIISKMRDALFEKFKNIETTILNNKSIEITIPEEYKNRYEKLLDDILELEIEIEPSGKIVINKSTGVVVISGDVKLAEAAVSYKNIDIYIKKIGKAYSEQEKQNYIFHIEESSDIKSLVDGLNKIGAKTEDIIAILYALKKANALFGEIIVE